MREEWEAMHNEHMEEEEMYSEHALLGEVVNPSLLKPFSAHPKVPTVDLNDCTLQIIVKMANIYLVRLSYFSSIGCKV